LSASGPSGSISPTNAEEGKTGQSREQIKFVSAIDSKPVYPAYIKLLSLQKFLKLGQAEKQASQGISSGKTSSNRQKTTSVRSIEKTEYDDMIRQLQGVKMLDNELKNCMEQFVDEPLR
jgi:hypothetical protein